MSWKFGPFTVSTREVADIESINEDFLSVVEEVTGELNEHNFVENAFSAETDRAKLADNVGIRLHHMYRTADPNVAVDDADPVKPHTIPVSTSWRPLDSTYEKLVVTNGGDLWILASFQVKTGAVYGALFALEINGTVMGDTLVGTGDIDNDQLESLDIVASGTVDFGALPSVWLPNAGAIVVEGVVTVSPGSYLIRPVIRNPRLHSNDVDKQEISNQELIIVEMR